MDKISLAHIGPVLSLDWCNPRASEGGWVASAGLDRTVKVSALLCNDFTVLLLSFHCNRFGISPFQMTPIRLHQAVVRIIRHVDLLTHYMPHSPSAELHGAQGMRWNLP